MAERNKKSLSYKIQKNPFMFVLLIIVIVVALFGVINLVPAIKETFKSSENETTTKAVEETVGATQEDKTIPVKNVKNYLNTITSVKAEKTDKGVAVTVEFKDNASLLKEHSATNVNAPGVIPVFCFYLNDGTQLNCPGELKLNGERNSAVYYLNDITDYANVVALVEEVTVTNENVLENKFNICLQSKTQTIPTKTVVGNYGKSIEELNNAAEYKANAVSLADGVKEVQIVKNSKFVWLDIYFEDELSYVELNNDFITNFVCFGFSEGGANYKYDFIISKNDSLNMIRCKFDTYSLKVVADEIGNSALTVDGLFTDYPISVWTSDYDNEIDLFCLNSVTDIKDNLDSGVTEESTDTTQDSTDVAETTEAAE
ncbi:MAG: hypothetical protein J6D06_09145 [Clostridia bacterium]|nr:hypothetical protein [Clostridia bacterium]